MNTTINGAKLYYKSHGQGDPLLMITGWGIDVSTWQNVVEPLSKDFRLILFDNRGAGRSEVTPGNYTTKMLADDAAALLDYLLIPKAHVLGWSMGGMIAQELAVCFPEKVDRLVLSATSARLTKKSSFIARSNIEAIRRGEIETSVNWELSFCFSRKLFSNPTQLAEIKESALNPLYPVSFEGLTSQFAAVAAHDRTGRLGLIKVPTLVIGAEEDGIIDVEQVRSLAGEIENAEFKLLPGAHMYHLEYPTEFSRAITGFLRKQMTYSAKR